MRIPRPSAALIVASAALFAGLGGTSYAALKISGANVVNGSLTGVDMANKSIPAKKLKPDSIGGTRVKESSLGTVPSAEHATSADKLGGLDANAYMQVKPRLFETHGPSIGNFGDGAILGTLDSVPGGTYLVTAKFDYDNDGPTEVETCTLHVPGADDSLDIAPANTQTVALQKVVTSATGYSASVTCTGDGDDDMLGELSIVALRVD